MSVRPAARTFLDLLVWQKAHQLAPGVYEWRRVAGYSTLTGRSDS
jgi:hypothetical protein